MNAQTYILAHLRSSPRQHASHLSIHPNAGFHQTHAKFAIRGCPCLTVHALPKQFDTCKRDILESQTPLPNAYAMLNSRKHDCTLFAVRCHCKPVMMLIQVECGHRSLSLAVLLLFSCAMPTLYLGSNRPIYTVESQLACPRLVIV